MENKKLEDMTVSELTDAAHLAASEWAQACLVQDVWVKNASSIRECPWLSPDEQKRLHATVEFLFNDCKDRVNPMSLAKLQALVQEISKRK